MVWGESACRNDAVDVGMREQVLSPGVKRADYADFGAQVFGIGGDFDDGLSAGSEQEIIEQTCVLQSQHVEFMGHSEHDMEIAGGQKFALPGRQPALAGLRLAVGAVAISARVIRDGLITAERALIAVTTPGQRYGSTEWPERLSVVESRSSIDTDPGSDRLARGGCRPPRGWADSFLVLSFKAAAEVLGTGQREAVQGIGDGLQVPLRQM